MVPIQVEVACKYWDPWKGGLAFTQLLGPEVLERIQSRNHPSPRKRGMPKREPQGTPTPKGFVREAEPAA